MGSLAFVLRPAERRDAEQIASIYAPIVRDTVISFEVDPPSPDTVASRIEAIQLRYPWLVAITGETVLGYAYASEHRQRAAYRWSVDVTAYVAGSARRQGVGRQLYLTLIAILRAQGFRSAFAGITLPNQASVGLHEAVGFAHLCVYKDVGFKLGAWRDVGWWSLAISNIVGPPIEPIDFDKFRQGASFNQLL
jgi:phosphinothricin acetyltransferase